MPRFIVLLAYGLVFAAILYLWGELAELIRANVTWGETYEDAPERLALLMVLPFMIVHGLYVYATISGWRLVDNRAAQEKSTDERFSGLTYVFDPDNLELSKQLAETYSNPAKREGKLSWPRTPRLPAARTPSTRRARTATVKTTSAGTRP